MAQASGGETVVGSAAQIFDEITTGDVREVRTYELWITPGQTLPVSVRSYYNQAGYLVITGEAPGHPNSSFLLKGDSRALYGWLVLVDRGRAYEYTTDAAGDVVVSPVPVEKIYPICNLPHGTFSSVQPESEVKSYQYADIPHLGAYPGTDLLTLQSLPGAEEVFYLDITRVMNGDTPINFSKEEMWKIWQSVASGLSMFQINVTTDPGVYATTLVQNSGIARFLVEDGRSFASLHSFGTTDFSSVFTGPTPNPSGGYDVGRTALHEIGHQLGVSHDRGQPGGEYFVGLPAFQWVPIMGNYWYGDGWGNDALYQWSKGEYDSATNFEDDLSIITGYLPYRSDDFASPVQLVVHANVLDVNANIGQIAHFNDSDEFSFTIPDPGGHATFHIDRIEYLGGAMLDVEAEIRNASGVVDPVVGAGVARYADIDTDLAAGDYTLVIRGGAEGTPADGFSSYSSMGFYAITGTVDSADSPALTDVAVVVNESIDTVVAGSAAANLVYTVVVSNNGPAPASGLQVSVPPEALPSGAVFGTITTGTGSFSAGTWTIGGLAVGANASLTVPITVGSSVAVGSDVISQSAAVSSLNEIDRVPANDSDAEATSVSRSVSLALSNIDSIDPVVAGSGAGNLTYVVTVTNSGPSDATGVALSEALTLPPGVTIVSMTPSAGTYTPPNAASGSWTVGALSASASATLTVVLTADASTAIGSNVIVSTATVTGLNEGAAGATNTERTSVDRQVDLVVSKTESIDPVVAGSGSGNLVFTVVVSNSGPSSATGVTVSEDLTLPAGVIRDSVATSAGGFIDTSAPDGLWTLDIPAGTSATLTVSLTADRSTVSGTDVIADTSAITGANETLINTGNDQASEVTSVTNEVDLVITRAESIDPVVAGSGAGNLVYTVVVNNNGPSDATGVTVSEDLTLPSGVSRDSATASTGTFVDTSAPDGLWTFDVTAGASATLTVTLTADGSTATGTDVIAGTATVTGANETLTDTGDDQASEATSVTREVDLVITKTESVDPVVAGSGAGNLVYVVTLSNSGPSDATGITVSEDLTLPAGVSRDSVVASVGSFADTSAPDGTWSLDLATGAVATLTVTLTASASATEGSDVIADTASITGANEMLINTGDDSVTESTSVTRESDLIISKVDDVDPINAGLTLTYTIEVSNDGPSDALGVVVIDTLPAGVSLVSTTGCSEDNSGVPTCTLDEVIAGGSKQYTVEVTVDGDTEGTITNSVSVAATTPLINPGDDSTTEDTLVVLMASLTNTLVGSDNPVLAGTTLTFSVGVGNSGPGDAASVTAFQVLPDGASYVSNTGGCSQPVNLEVLRGDLEGVNVVGPVVTTASGEVAMVLDTVSNELTYTLHLSGLPAAVTVTAAHIHLGAAGGNGPIVNTLYSGNPLFDDGNPITGTIQLTQTEADDLLNLAHYVVVHTTANPGGEVRAQLTPAVQVPLYCDLGAIVASGAGGFAVTLQVPADAADGAVLRTTTMAQSATDDVNVVLLPAPNGTGALEGATAYLETTVGAEADLVITKTDSLDPVVAGNSLVYTVRVTNNGPSDAQNVVVSDTLPAGVTFASTNGCDEDSNGVPTCTLGNIAAGAFGEYTITVGVDSSTLGTITNTASVSSSTSEGNPGAESVVETTLVNAAADLSITKTDSVDPVIAGESLTYTVSVSNSGPSDALGVVVTDILPAGVTLVSTSGCVEDGAGVPACSLGTVSAGALAEFTITVDVLPETRGVISNSASVASSTIDSNAGNDSDSEDTAINPRVDLTLVKTDAVDPLPSGHPLSYTLAVTNNGPSRATGVVVTDNLPSEVTLVSTSGCSEDPVAGPTCTLGSIDPGATSQYTITVQVNLAPPAAITNAASVTSVEPETNPTDNSDDETTSLDNIAPFVTALDSVSGTGDGSIDECETALVRITELVVNYSEFMRDPVGDIDSDDVTNPANYMVVDAGLDGDISTSTCGVTFDDDRSLQVNAVFYDSVSHQARLLVEALPSSRIRVIACAALTDLAGNPLDGNGDSSGGDDFVRTFRADPGNLFFNGHFDCSSDGLTPWAVSDPVEITYSTDDIIGATQSGSVQVDQLAANTFFWINQCVPIGGVAERGLSARLRLSAPGSFSFISYTAGCEFFAGSSCGTPGSGISSSVVTDLLLDTGGTWLTQQGVTVSPTGAGSALCGFSYGSSNGDDFTAWLDDFFLSGGGHIFSDGFESGDSSEWWWATPKTVPGPG